MSSHFEAGIIMSTNLSSQVLVNQVTPVDIQSGVSTLSDIMNFLALESNAVAIAVNNVVISKSTWSQHTLSDGDNINVFGAIAGG